MTDTTNTNAAAIAAGLTAGEKQGLRDLDNGLLPIGFIPQLMEKKLIMRMPDDRGYNIRYAHTQLGRDVLNVIAALEAAPAEARPATITVRQYYRENYVAKELKKECKVSVPGFPASWLDTVYDHQNHYTVMFQDHEGTHSMDFAPDETLVVTWLDPAPTPPAQAVGEVIDWLGVIKKGLDDAMADSWYLHATPSDNPEGREVITKSILDAVDALPKLQADLATLRRELAASRERERVAREALDQARQTFVTIQSHPDIETEIDYGALIQAMIDQAVCGAEQAAAAVLAATEAASEG